jgi:hypothetical protein
MARLPLSSRWVLDGLDMIEALKWVGNLTRFTPQICQLPNLRYFRLSMNPITELPDMSACKSINSLVFEATLLSTLPDFMASWKLDHLVTYIIPLCAQ